MFRRLTLLVLLGGIGWATVSGVQAQTPSPRTVSQQSLSANQRLEAIGLVDVATLDSTLIVSLPYATPQNFTGEILYEDLDHAFLQPDVAAKLSRALQILRARHPELRLIVYDAARPLAIQRRMWDKVKGTPQSIYVSNPDHGGGLHNYGAAVDVTLADRAGNPLPMGTPFDFFGPEAHIDREAELVAQGKITDEEARNRQLLRQVMREAGFIPLRSEWWHFNAMRLAEAKLRYQPIE